MRLKQENIEDLLSHQGSPHGFPWRSLPGEVSMGGSPNLTPGTKRQVLKLPSPICTVVPTWAGWGGDRAVIGGCDGCSWRVAGLWGTLSLSTPSV